MKSLSQGSSIVFRGVHDDTYRIVIGAYRHVSSWCIVMYRHALRRESSSSSGGSTATKKKRSRQGGLFRAPRRHQRLPRPKLVRRDRHFRTPRGTLAIPLQTRALETAFGPTSLAGHEEVTAAIAKLIAPAPVAQVKNVFDTVPKLEGLNSKWFENMPVGDAVESYKAFLETAAAVAAKR